MVKVLPLLVLLAASVYGGIYNNCDGCTFSETALLSAPDKNADTLVVLPPGTPLTLFGRTVRNDSNPDWCKLSAFSDPETVGFVLINDLALAYNFYSSGETVLMYGFSDSEEWTDTRSTLRLTRNGRIVDSTTFNINTIPAPGDWNYDDRGYFIQINESGLENVSAAYILHFPERESDWCSSKMMVVLKEDNTIISGPSVSTGAFDDFWYYSSSCFVTPEETSVDNIVNTVVLGRTNAVEAEDTPETYLFAARSIWNGNSFETDDEPCVLALPGENTSYLTQVDLEPFRLSNDFRAGGFQILGYPEPLLPPGAENLEVIPVSFSTEPNDFTSVIIAFSYPEGWLPLDTLLSPGYVNTAKLYGQWMEETETLKLYPNGAMSSSYPINIWRRDNEWKFHLISEEVRDAAEIAYAAMDSLLAEEKIAEAENWLNYILMSKMSDRTHAEIAVQFFYPAVNACMHSDNGLQPLEEANRAFALMGMRNWFIEIPSQGRDVYLESEFAQYINIGNLKEGLGCLSQMAEARGDSVYAAELENAINSLNPPRE